MTLTTSPMTRRRIAALPIVAFLLLLSASCAAPAPAAAPTNAAVAAAPTKAPAAAAPTQAPAAAPAAASKPIVLKYAGPEAADHPLTEMQNVFARRLGELSNGRIKVEVYPANQLGPQTSQVDQMVAGTLESMYGAMAYGARYAPSLAVVSLPYAMKSDEQAYKVMDGPFGQKLAKYVENNSAIKVLSYLKLGFLRAGNAKKPMQTLDDLKGFKLRVLPAPIHVKAFEALGATPVAMDYAEVYTSIQTKVIDGAEFPLPTWWQAKFYEVVKNITYTDRTYDWMAQYINKKFYDGLSPDLQKAVSQAATEAADWQRKKWTELDNNAVAFMQGQGVKFYKLSDADMARARDLTRGVDKEFEKDFGADLIKEFRDLTR